MHRYEHRRASSDLPSPRKTRGSLLHKNKTLSDKIAYVYHDVDDAIRAEILTEDDIPVSYTHLDVYKRQEQSMSDWRTGSW